MTNSDNFDIFLVYPGASAPPYGLMSISGVLEKHGFVAKIADFTDEEISEENVRKKIPSEPAMIGITSYSTPMIARAIKITKILQNSYSGTFIMWGGAHANLFPVQTLNELEIDAVCVGEGEYTILELVKTLKDNPEFEELIKVKGLWLRKENGTVIPTGERPFIKDLDELPRYAWHLIDMDKYIWTNPLTNRRGIILISSRGCPYRCTFCYTYKLFGGKWRGMSVERLLCELAFLHDHYDITNVRLQDDLAFGGNKKKMLKFCEKIKETGIESWHIDYRVNLIDRSLLEAMKKAGCEEIFVGAESGSPRILKEVLKKGITVEDTIKALDLCYEIGIRTYAGFIIGLPSETIEDLNNSLNLARRIKATQCRAVNYVSYPGTELYELAKDYGFHEPDKMIDWALVGDFQRSNLNLSLASDKELTHIKNKIEGLTYIKSLKYGFKHKDLSGILPILTGRLYKSHELSIGIKYLQASFHLLANLWSFLHGHIRGERGDGKK